MPRQVFALLLLILMSLSCHGSGWKQLFNGSDLTGWSGDLRLWRVENGVLIGETDSAEKKVSSNTFLIWQGGELGDFELQFSARVTGNNSGVQYRSHIIDPEKWIVGGYQMDLHPRESYLGMLFEEKGRGIACERGQKVKLTEKLEPLGTIEVHPVNLADWNSYRIVARGSKLLHFINGNLAAEVEDTNAEKCSSKGIIALQLHTGEPMRAEFKDIRVQQISKDKRKGETPAWIWKREQAADNEKIFFRREFQLPTELQSANVTIMCDDAHILFVNGTEIGTNRGWATSHSYEILSHLKQGSQNIIAILGKNDKGAAGLLVRFRATQKDGKKLNVITDHNWLCSSEAAEGWTSLNFQHPSWQKAVVVRKMGEDPWLVKIAPDVEEAIPNKSQ